MNFLDNPILAALAVLSTLVFILSIRSFLTILPSLLQCLDRWKTNLEIEDSHQLARSRNLIAAELFIPACMISCFYSLYSPDFFEKLSPVFQVLVTAGVMIAYFLLRTFLNWQLEMHNYGGKEFSAANRSFYSYFITLFIVVFLTGAILRTIIPDEGSVKRILLWIIGVYYVFFLYRKGQIFASVCNPFITFLYLCGLEILPTGTLVLSAALL